MQQKPKKVKPINQRAYYQDQGKRLTEQVIQSKKKYNRKREKNKL